MADAAVVAQLISKGIIKGDLWPLRCDIAAQHHEFMRSGLIIRVFCADGPCFGQGAQYLQVNTGRILFNEACGVADSIYEIAESSGYMHSSVPAAHFVGFAEDTRLR